MSAYWKFRLRAGQPTTQHFSTFRYLIPYQHPPRTAPTPHRSGIRRDFYSDKGTVGCLLACLDCKPAFTASRPFQAARHMDWACPLAHPLWRVLVGSLKSSETPGRGHRLYRHHVVRHRLLATHIEIKELQMKKNLTHSALLLIILTSMIFSSSATAQRSGQSMLNRQAAALQMCGGFPKRGVKLFWPVTRWMLNCRPI